MKKTENLKPKVLQRLELRFKHLIYQDKDCLKISRDFIEQTLKDLYYLRNFHKDLSEKEECYLSSRSELQTLKNRLQNQDALLRSIDLTYMVKMDDLKTEISELLS